MKARARHFVFRQGDDMAAIVEKSLVDRDSLMELNWDEPAVCLGIAKPQQISSYQNIYAVIAIHHRYDTQKNADMYEEEDIAELEALLDAARDSARTVRALRSSDRGSLSDVARRAAVLSMVRCPRVEF